MVRALFTGEPKTMMYLETPPQLIETTIFSAMPDNFRRKGVTTDWADANRPGAPTDCFIEGPSFDKDGNLYIVDIPFGRIFRIAPDKTWSLVVEYDGWPNGLKIDQPTAASSSPTTCMASWNCDAKAGRMRHGADLAQFGIVSRLQRPASRLQRRHLFHRPGPDRAARSHRARSIGYTTAAAGSIACSTPGSSPNGLVLDPNEAVLFVAMTRDNAVWRLPFMKDGSVSKVGRFCSLFGPSGPDGMTMDRAGRLFVAHASLGHVFVFAPNGKSIARIESCDGPSCTNVAIGSTSHDRLLITESVTGKVLVADISGLKWRT